MLEIFDIYGMLRRVAKGLLIYFYRHQGFVLRALLCWLMACLILINDEVRSYDQRFQIRGQQKASSEIVLLSFRLSDFAVSDHVGEYTESSFWDEELWTLAINKILLLSPKSIGITLFIPDSLPPLKANSILLNEKIFWATNGNFRPLGTNFTASNIGNTEFLRDNDGVIRRFYSSRSELPHLAEKVSDHSKTNGWIPEFINFRGDQKSFKEFYIQDLISDKIKSEDLKDKIILIGAEGLPSFNYQTPMGNFSRSQLIAHISDNLLHDRWIFRAPYSGYALLLLVFMSLSVFIIHQYPQKVAFAFLLWLGLLSSSLSIWVFDSFYFWLPLVSPLTTIIFCWIIFVGYQATKMEQKTWKLKQEQLYLSGLEKLKNNFVSLISHDLKTPIAKIQSIVDRLLLQNNDEKLLKDLRSLRSSSEELHKYIQSILQLLRVESRDFRLHKEVCDINELIDQAVQHLKPLATDKNIQILSQLEPLFSIEADVTLIREVLINLIDNAIKYTPPGGEIKIHSGENEDSIFVKVLDNGEGIAEDEKDSIWNKFTRGKDQDLKSKGTGLGLYLVKYFIELHGGQVHLESRLNHGTEVQFTLPLEADI